MAGANLKPMAELKSLGVILDSRLTFDAHVSAVSKACNYHLWALRHIRHLLTLDVANTVAWSIVDARLDYCNSLLYGAPRSTVAILQWLQNAMARVVQQQPRRTHAEPLLCSLHWLPIKRRINYKIAVLTYKVRAMSTPHYLNSLLSHRVTGSRMALRSASRALLIIPVTRTIFASHAFSVCAPVVWNMPAGLHLCDCFTPFTKRLKTFLLRSAFDT